MEERGRGRREQRNRGGQRGRALALLAAALVQRSAGPGGAVAGETELMLLLWAAGWAAAGARVGAGVG